MGLVDQVLSVRNQGYPLPSEIGDFESEFGHRDEFSPAKYGSYIATSNLIYAAVTLRARRLSTIPIRAYHGSDENKKLQTTGPVPDLLKHVNPFWTWPRLVRQTEQCMGLWGEAFWAVQKNASGTPTDLWWVRSDRMHPVPHSTKYLAGFLYEPTLGGPQIPFAADEVIWFRYPNPLDEFAGLSPLAASRLAADTHQQAMTSNRQLHDQGLQLGGVISPAKDRATYSPEQADELEKKLKARLAGKDNTHRWAVLRFEAAVQQMTVSPRDAEWLGGLNFNVREVARAYGIPSPLLMDLEHATLANVREFDRMLWELALVPDEEFFVAELHEQLLPMFPTVRGRTVVDHLEPDFSGVAALQESQSAVWDRERQQVESGLRTINEWRIAHGLPSVAWGDVWWAPVNKSPVADGTGHINPPDPETVAAANGAAAMQQVATSAVDESAKALLEEVKQMFDDFTVNGAAHV